jgi:hypothetical protein
MVGRTTLARSVDWSAYDTQIVDSGFFAVLGEGALFHLNRTGKLFLMMISAPEVHIFKNKKPWSAFDMKDLGIPPIPLTEVKK